MGGVIGSCLGSLAAGCACSICKSCLPSTTKSSKVAYILVLVVSIVLSLVLRYWGAPLLVKLPIYGDIDICTSDKCYGVGAVFRISFASFTFFTLHAILVRCMGAAVDRGWVLKLLGFPLLILLAFLIPDVFFDYYAQVARVVAGIFLVLQCMYLLHGIYEWRDALVAAEKQKIMMAVTLGAYVVSGVAMGLLYAYFGGSECQTNVAIISVCLVTTLVFSALSVSSFSRHGIMPASLVTLYCYWVIYSALTSDPTECNPVKSNNIASLILSIVWATLSISYAGYTVAHNVSNESLSDNGAAKSEHVDTEREPLASAANLTPEEKAARKEAELRRIEDMEVADAGGAQEEAPTDDFKSANWRFHTVLACCSMFMAMQLSNWQTVSQSDNGVYSMGPESMWIKVVTQWLVALIYGWTIMAPVCLPGRDFD